MKRITMTHLNGAELTQKQMLFLCEYAKDANARRAALAIGASADSGYTIRDNEQVQIAYAAIVEQRMQDAAIDATWVLYEAVDNHTIARQSGNITASNTALKLIASLASVDAFAAEKILIASDKEVMQRLNRGRKRMNQDNDDDDDVSFL